MALALDRKAFIDILTEGKATWVPPCCRRRRVNGRAARGTGQAAGLRRDVAQNLAEARKIMAGLGYGPDKPLKVKVSTRTSRSIATPR